VRNSRKQIRNRRRAGDFDQNGRVPLGSRTGAIIIDLFFLPKC
jgi:hypothetical protein